MSDLAGYLELRVAVVTTDGRLLFGQLKGCDQATNLILADCEERVVSLTEPVETIPLGLYLVRGDTVVVVGKVDQLIDNELSLDQMRAEPIASLYH